MIFVFISIQSDCFMCSKKRHDFLSNIQILYWKSVHMTNRPKLHRCWRKLLYEIYFHWSNQITICSKSCSLRFLFAYKKNRKYPRMPSFSFQLFYTRHIFNNLPWHTRKFKFLKLSLVFVQIAQKWWSTLLLFCLKFNPNEQ